MVLFIGFRETVKVGDPTKSTIQERNRTSFEAPYRGVVTE